MGSQGTPADRFVRCRFPLLVDCSQTSKHSQSSRATPSIASLRTQPIELPDIQLLRDFVTAHDLSLEAVFSSVWALVLRCYVGADAVSFGYASAQEMLVYQIDLAGASSFLDLARRCRAAAVPVDKLEGSAEFDTLLSADRSTLSCELENSPVRLTYDG